MNKIWYLLIVPSLLLLLILDRPSLLPQSNQSSGMLDRAEVDFDSWSTGINSILFDVNGQIEYTLQAARQVHFLDDTTELDRPFLRIYQPTGESWNILASSGRILPELENRELSGNSTNISRIDLIDDVELYQTDDFGNRTVLRTAFLSVDPALETLTTDLPVHLSSKFIEQTAVGMHADLIQNTVTFSSQVRGIYDTNAPR